MTAWGATIRGNHSSAIIVRTAATSSGPFGSPWSSSHWAARSSSRLARIWVRTDSVASAVRSLRHRCPRTVWRAVN